MARRLKAIAEYINRTWSGYTAEITEGYCNTDRKIGRLRVPGKGRTGNRLIVRNDRTDKVVLDHNAAETYRRNEEVEAWVNRVEEGRKGPWGTVLPLPLKRASDRRKA